MVTDDKGGEVMHKDSEKDDKGGALVMHKDSEKDDKVVEL